jgi:hypothetical protein
LLQIELALLNPKRTAAIPPPAAFLSLIGNLT